MNTVAREIVARVRNLPPVPDAALKLVSLLNQPAFSNDEVVDLLKRDNVLTAKLLRACNSPFFGLREPVSSVDQAVLTLGHQEILHIVLTLAFGGAMTSLQADQKEEATQLWRHSLTSASAAEVLANENLAADIESSICYTGALLHDMGKLVLNQTLSPEKYEAIRTAGCDEGLSRSAAETATLGADHSEVGACLLQNWHLPPDIVEGVAEHHRPRVEPRPGLSSVIHAADWLAHISSGDPGWEQTLERLDRAVASALGIAEPAVEHLVAEMRKRIEEEEHLNSLC